MTEALNGLVNEAKKNKFSIGHDLSNEDIVSVWDNVSQFIEKQMNNQKGVLIPGLGTFTFSQQKLDVGNNNYLLIQRPIFAVAEKFSSIHSLRYTKHHTTGQIPVVHLNYSALAFESPFTRDTVEMCVREVLNALSRSVANRKNVEFTFNGIGRLQIRNSKIKMKFYKEFVQQMDGSGKLMNALQNRPGTVDSVMSDRAPSRPLTSNTLTLPRINNTSPNGVTMAAADGENAMPTIQEEETAAVTSPAPDKAKIPVNNLNNNAENQMPVHSKSDILKVDEIENEDFNLDENVERTQALLDDTDLFNLEFKEDILKKPSPPPGLPPSRQGSRMSLCLPKAAAVSFAEDLLPAGLESPKFASPSPKFYSAGSMRRSLSPINHAHSATPRLEGLDTNVLDRYIPEKTPSPALNGSPVTGLKTPTPPGTGCGHRNAGQELCYLCHQRSKKNVYVSFTEERKQRETEEDKLLQQYQQLKDVEAIFKEQEQDLEKKHDSKKTAAFNLGVAEAIKQNKTTRETDFHPSYVFQKRPLTPPRFLKRDEYYKDLAEQVTSKKENAKKRKADEDFIERLEQVQLAEDLAAQREQYLKDRLTHQEMYKKALSAQIRFKPLPIPARVSDSSEPVFGKNDMNNDGLYDRRRRAHNLYKEQVETVEQKKREAILRHLSDQKEEEKMLERTKKELLEDRASRYERLIKSRKNLESDWLASADTKKAKETNDKLYMKSPGALLLQQTDPYKRCGQCKRKVNNCGESNIWRESRYIPGSRLIV